MSDKTDIDLTQLRAVDWGRRNCGALSPNGVSNDDVMSQGSADEAVVVIKLCAEEGYGDIPDKFFSGPGWIASSSLRSRLAKTAKGHRGFECILSMTCFFVVPVFTLG